MTQQGEALFDTTPYEDLRVRIPETLGKAANYFNNGQRLIEIELIQRELEVYRPNMDFDITDCQFRSPGYPIGTKFEGRDFIAWDKVEVNFSASSNGNVIIEGYLGGFPRIYEKNTGYFVDCLHFWSNNESVFDYTFAIPLRSLSGLYVFSKQRTEFEKDLDAQYMGERSRYEVILARDSKTGKEITNAAGIEEVQSMIDRLNEPALTVFSLNIWGVRSSGGASRAVDEEKLKEVLNDYE